MKLNVRLSAGGKVDHNLPEFVVSNNFQENNIDEVVSLTEYMNTLRFWWKFKCNSDKPIEVINIAILKQD